MPQIEWKRDNMKYSFCFFPLIGAVIGLLIWLWSLLCVQLGSGIFCLRRWRCCFRAVDRRDPPGWLLRHYGRTGIPSDRGAEAGDFEGFSHGCLCHDWLRPAFAA
ncbi:MAG: hypothetical protein ACLSB9_03675 [Hydrogeniiclostridium mannosilyticum]